MDDLDQMTDAQLLRSWQTHDRAAGRLLYRRHCGAVDRFFRNKVSEPEDLIQRTFTVCLQAPGNYQGRSKFQTYLLGIAYRLLLKHYRDNARLGDHAGLDGVSVRDLGQSPSQVLTERDTHRKLLEALRRLPLSLQVTIELRFWEGMKVREIADTLEQPEGTIKDRIRRSKIQLERSLAELDASADPLHRTATRLEDWAEQFRQTMHSTTRRSEDA